MSKRLERAFDKCSCCIVTGDRGAGKSSLFAYIIDYFRDIGYEVYCQYPYKDCLQIPLVEHVVNGVIKRDVNKEWLYTANLSHSVVLIDEASTVWPNRGYARWSASDDEFFNFIRKNDTRLFLATQAYDKLDLNVKRASDYTYYLTSGIWHFTHIETSYTTLAKVADKNTEVEGRLFKQGMRKISYDICEIPCGNYLFWRKPWYNKFISTYTFYEKPFIKVPAWEEIIDFDELQEKQGYIENSLIIDKIRDFLTKLKEQHSNIKIMSLNDKIDENNDTDYFYDQPIDDLLEDEKEEEQDF